LPDGRPYLVMEFLVGSTLDARLRDDPPSGQELRRLLGQACDGLAAIHGAGIVHRDLKPENLWVVRAEDGETSIKLLDFGISKMEGAKKLTETGVPIGTPYYISPEQLGTQTADARSDIYTFGVILYEVFSGRLPFLADAPLPLMKKIMFDEPPPLVAREGYAISPKLDRLIRDCLAKKPAARPQSAMELKQRLLAALDGPPPQETAVAVAAMTAPRRRVYWIVAGSLVCALAAGIFVMWARAGANAKGPNAIAPSSPLPATRPAVPPASAPALPTDSAPLIARPPAAAGAHVARRNPQPTSTRARVPAPLSEPSALQPGPALAAPVAPAPPANRAPTPSPVLNSPSPSARAALPAVEAPKPSRPLTPSERDLITDKDILLR